MTQPISELPGKHIGYDTWHAVPIPVEHLGGLKTDLTEGERIEVPESVVAEGITARNFVFDKAKEYSDLLTNDYSPISAALADDIEQKSRGMFADFYQDVMAMAGVEVLFVSGEVIEVVKDDGDDGTAGVPAMVEV